MEDEHHTLRTLTFNIIYITKVKVNKTCDYYFIRFFSHKVESNNVEKLPAENST